MMKLLLFRCLKRLSLGLLLALSGRAAAQGTSPSVLKEQRQRLARYLPDTTRVRLLTTLCYEMREEETAQAVGYGEAGVALARTLPADVQAPLLLQGLLSLSSC